MSDEQTTTKKALTINLSEDRYGTFAEIGAGQEVARHFFQAGHASNTIAKTMSAYDKKFSDDIYGKGSRFVSKERLQKMLSHEYDLLLERLGPSRGKESKFFAFANTVATSSHEQDSESHCWMGVRFQESPGGEFNEVIIHVRMLDFMRLQQQEALGILGVNLLFSCFFLMEMESDFVSSLIENIGNDRIEIDYIEATGSACQQVDSRLLSLELVKQGLTPAVLFGENGQPQPLSDTIYGQQLIIQRGQYRPITNVNMDILESSERQYLSQSGKEKPLALFEITMSALKQGGVVDQKDFLDRVDTITCLGHHVLISNYKLLAQLKTMLRRCTKEDIVFVIGAGSLDVLMSQETYATLDGGLLEGLGETFDESVTMYVYPFKSDEICLTTQSYFPEPVAVPLFKYLLESGKLRDIEGCDAVNSSLEAQGVREMMAKNETGWEKLVPEKVAKMIKSKKLFGFGDKS